MSLFTSAKDKSRIGVDFQSAGVAVAMVSASSTAAGQLLKADFLPAIGQLDQIDALKSWVVKEHLQKHPCICLISAQDCDIFQVEKPQVDAAEMAQALIWRIKDLINYDVSAAVVENYPMPKSNKNNTEQVSVVAANESVIGAYVEGIKTSNLKLLAIDIHDLVVQYLSCIRSSEDRSIAVLSFDESSGKLMVYNSGDLHVSRGFKIGLDQLKRVDSEDQSTFDSLLLEVQRSMDYFESYYGLGAVTQLMIFPQSPVTEKMGLYLQNLTNFDIDFISIYSEDAQTGNTTLPEYCFHAYCAALRGAM
ncbi:MAG: MSHA biogenesis protein MshI [Gammaproteobacteria bacterium]